MSATGEYYSYTQGEYCSYAQILRLTLPAIALSAASPATSLVQTILLGRLGWDATNQVAAFAVTSAVANFVQFLLNFLVDGAGAKIGKYAGERKWKHLATNVKLSMLFAAVCGVLASGAMLLFQYPVEYLLSLQQEVSQHYRTYWHIRAAIVPLQMWSMAMSGVLQGYNRVGLNAILTVGQSILELTATAVVLSASSPWAGTLRGLGYASLSCAALGVCALTTAVLCSRPTTAPPDFSVFADSGPQSPPPFTRESASPIEGRFTELDGERFFSVTGPEISMSLSRDSEDEELFSSPMGGRRTSSASEDPTEPLLPPPSEEEAAGPRGWCCELWVFMADGLNMIVRSALLQATFLTSVSCAGRLGAAALAAHQIVSQLWLLTSYVVDGFAAAGTILGSRLVAMKQDPTALKDLRALCCRLLSFGVGTGLVSGVLFFNLEGNIIRLFTRDEDTIGLLRGRLWLVLCLIQPVNAGVFVYDGLLYGSQAFVFVRNMMCVGFFLVFCPILITNMAVFHSLWSIWVAKAALNIWRFLAAAYYIHGVIFASPS